MATINPIAAQFKPIAPISGAPVAQLQKTGEEFAARLQEALSAVNTQQLKADEMSLGLATGEVQDLHRAVMAIAEADLSFRYVLQVRNKIIDAYQEIMRMQI